MISNQQVRERTFLSGMYQDAYYPDTVVDKARNILVALAERIEAERPTDLPALYALTAVATVQFNDLEDDFEEAGSEIETVARELICEEFAFLAGAYGFAEADAEELTAARDW